MDTRGVWRNGDPGVSFFTHGRWRVWLVISTSNSTSCSNTCASGLPPIPVVVVVVGPPEFFQVVVSEYCTGVTVGLMPSDVSGVVFGIIIRPSSPTLQPFSVVVLLLKVGDVAVLPFTDRPVA